MHVAHVSVSVRQADGVRCHAEVSVHLGEVPGGGDAIGSGRRCAVSCRLLGAIGQRGGGGHVDAGQGAPRDLVGVCPRLVPGDGVRRGAGDTEALPTRTTAA